MRVSMVTFLWFFHKKIESLSRLQCGRGGGRGAAVPRIPFKINAARSLTKKFLDVFYVFGPLKILSIFGDFR